METNVLPFYDMSDNPTGCCPRFKPEGWDEAQLHTAEKIYYFYTTCPKCAKVYGKNYVVAVAKIL